MHIDHVGLNVRDLDAAAAWYSEAFGMTTAMPFDVPPIQLRGVFLTNSDGFAIELLQREGSKPGVQPTSVPEAALTWGYSHLCFRVDEVEPLHRKLLAMGATEIMSVRPSPEPGVTMSYVADPDGNLIEIIDRKTAVK